MARTALTAPAHRIAQRMPLGGSLASQDLAPSVDFGGGVMQDMRLGWNTANSATGAAAIGWPSDGPVIDAVPSTLSTVAIAAAQVPVAATKLTLVSSTGGGITVMATALLTFPSLNTIAVGSLAIDGVPGYNFFGVNSRMAAYDETKMLARNIQILSVGDDHLATVTVVGADVYGYPMTETITLTNASTATGKKAFKFIFSITPAGTLSGSNVSVGQGDTYGMPICANRASMVTGFWNNLIVTGAGTFTAAVTTSPATATTGDVRGTYLVGSASNGTKRLTLRVAPDFGFMVTNGFPVGITGVTQA